MNWLDLHPIFLQVATFLFGILSGLAGSYIKLYSDISYIKGQLSEVLKFSETITEVVDNHAKLETRVQLIETKMSHGGLYG